MNSRYYILIIVGIVGLFLLCNMASATDITLEYPKEGYSYTQDYIRTHPYFSFNVTNYNTSSTDGTLLSGYVTTLIKTAAGAFPVGYRPAQLHYAVNITVTGNGIFNTSEYDYRSLPFNDKNYTANFTFLNCTDNSTLWFGQSNFSMGDALDKPYYISYRDFVPYHLDFGGINAIHDGIVYYTTCNLGVNTGQFDIIYIHLTDNTSVPRAIIAEGERKVMFHFLDDEREIGIDWQRIHVTGSVLDTRTGYFFYTGLHRRTDAGGELCYATILDDTAFLQNYTTDYVNIHDDYSKAWDMVGVKLYFETYSQSKEDGRGWSPDTSGQGTLGQSLKDYGAELGMPWFHLAIAGILIIICVCIPGGFAHQYDIDLPNFIYGICAVVGIVITYAIGLLDLWMMVFIMSIILLTIVFKYKDKFQALIGRAQDYRKKEDT